MFPFPESELSIDLQAQTAKLAYQAVEKSPLTALLQKVQTLTYVSIRFSLELFLRLASGFFEQPAELDCIDTQLSRPGIQANPGSADF